MYHSAFRDSSSIDPQCFLHNRLQGATGSFCDGLAVLVFGGGFVPFGADLGNFHANDSALGRDRDDSSGKNMSAYLVKTYSERGRFLKEDFEHGIHPIFSGQAAQHDSWSTFLHDDRNQRDIDSTDLKELFHDVFIDLWTEVVEIRFNV